MKFSELSVGQKFKINEVEYTRIEDIKVSCCKKLNAIDNSNQTRVMIKPTDEVELVTE